MPPGIMPTRLFPTPHRGEAMFRSGRRDATGAPGKRFLGPISEVGRPTAGAEPDQPAPSRPHRGSLEDGPTKIGIGSIRVVPTTIGAPKAPLRPLLLVRVQLPHPVARLAGRSLGRIRQTPDRDSFVGSLRQQKAPRCGRRQARSPQRGATSSAIAAPRQAGGCNEDSNAVEDTTCACVMPGWRTTWGNSRPSGAAPSVDYLLRMWTTY